MGQASSAQWNERWSRGQKLADGLTVALWSGAGIVAIDAGFELGRWPRAILLLLWLILGGGLLRRALRPRQSYIPIKRSPFLRAGITLGLALIVGSFASGSADRLGRVIFPWKNDQTDRPFRILVPSGSTTIPRGESVTLVGYLEPVRQWRHLPEQVELVLRTASDSAETRLAMHQDDQSAFWFTWPKVTENFEYRLEAGSERSDWHQISVADPVHLLDSTQILVRPPTYAESQIPSRTWTNWNDLEALASSKLHITLRFDRPVDRVRLDWKPVQSEPIPVSVKLDPDRTAGIATLEVRQTGVLHLQLFGTRNLRTEALAMVRVLPDQPPRFEKVVGLSPNILEARPDDRVLLELAARDDLQIAKVWVEYVVGSDEVNVQSLPLRIPGVGTSRMAGTAIFPLAGKVRAGETIRFRVVVADHRQLLQDQLGSQEVRFPPANWSTLRISDTAEPLAEQEVIGQRNRIEHGLTKTAPRVREALTVVRQVRGEKPGDGPLSLDQSVRLREAGEQLGTASKELNTLIQELQLVPELEPFAEELRQYVQKFLRPAEHQLRLAQGAAKAQAKEQAFGQATDKLVEADRQLHQLQMRNLRLADVRSGLRGLRELSSEQRDLAEQALRADTALEQISARQNELNARLAELLSQSQLLGESLREAGQEEIRQTLERTRDWLSEQNQLRIARAATERCFQDERLFRLRHEQRSVRELAIQLGDRSATAARVAGSAPTRLLPFERAAELLASRDATAAVAEQEKAARELERVAQELRRGVAIREELREATRQLARWQDDLRRRYSDARANLSTAMRQSFAAEQADIQATLYELKLTETAGEYAKTLTRAKDDLGKCLAALQQPTPPGGELFQQAADTLNQLAELTPTRTERLKAAKWRLEQLRKDQEALRREIDLAIQNREQDPGDEQLVRIAVKQDQLRERLKRLDVPSLEPRRAIVQTLAGIAATDLRRGFIADVQTSQLLLKKQLDKLRLSLDGQPLPEELLQELAQEQQTLARTLERVPRLSPTHLAQLETQQRNRNRQLSRIPDDDAPLTLAELRDQSEALAQAFRQAASLEQLRQQAEALNRNLQILIQRLIGAESDLTRVARLAQERQAEYQASKEPRVATAALAQLIARRADQHLEVLSQTRVGIAWPAKRKALESLEKLRQSPAADRQAILQREAAEAMAKLSDAIQQKPERARPWRELVPDEISERQRMESLQSGGRLPNLAAAEYCEELARVQQTLRDATVTASAALNRGVPMAKTDLVQPLINTQASIIREASPAWPNKRPEQDRELLAALRNGDLERGVKAAKGLLGQLQPMPPLAQRQQQLIEQLEQLQPRLELEATRQSRRQQELIQDILGLSLELKRLALHRGGMLNDRLLLLAQQLDHLREQLELAQRHREAQRLDNAFVPDEQARRIGESIREQVETDLKKLPTAKVEPDPVGLTGAALLTALDATLEVTRQLRQANGKRIATESMQSAADAMTRSANRLESFLLTR